MGMKQPYFLTVDRNVEVFDLNENHKVMFLNFILVNGFSS